jgi:hypothetical protein
MVYISRLIVFDKSIIKKMQNKIMKFKTRLNLVKIEKAKQTEKERQILFHLSVCFILCLFIFIYLNL